MKLFKRSLAVILTLCMVLGVVPFTAFASENTSAVSENPNTFHRIVHLDCGRKYFTADWIKALINEMAAAGYTQLQLAFGNDGLRFLLDDMSVTVNSTTYSSDKVTAGVQAGNKTYYNAGDVNELTESEMDEIITHAQSMGIEIVPHLNMPGHMDAVLDAIEYVGITDAHFTGYTTSVRSLNLNNDAAVAFAKALLQKYVNYFAAKGCKFFHIGADEFGNDAYGQNVMGFPNMGNTLYTKFADFVNDCSVIVKASGMTPRAWNDGISYGSYTDNFDTEIQITYWSSGWPGYNVASAATLSNNGHDMINTNGTYYYILGVNDNYTAGTTTNHVGYDYTAAASFSNTTFSGGTISNPAGSMFCIWGDVPGAETETEVAKYIRPILRVMAARMKDSDSYEVESIVTGGFNADGTINYVTVENNNVSVTAAAALNGLTVTGTTAPEIEGAAGVVAYEFEPVTAAGAYTGSATVAVPVPDGWDTARMGAFVVNADNTVTKLTGAVNGNKYEFTMPHFSVGGVYEAAEVLEDTVVLGASTAVTYVQDTDGLDGGSQYLIVNSDKTYALTNTKGSLGITVSGSNATPIGDASSAHWTYTETGSGWNTHSYLTHGSSYLYPSRSGSYNPTYTLNISTVETNVSITAQTTGSYRVSNSYINSYIAYTSGAWGAASSGNTRNLYFYKYTAGIQTYTVNAALQESRISALDNVTNDNYTVESWAAYESARDAAQAKLTAVETASYNSEDNANTALNELIAAVDTLEAAKNALAKAVTITIKYVLPNGTVVKTETRNVSEADTTVTVANFNANDKYYTVTNSTLAITPADDTTYEVEVIEAVEDLSKVDPLVVETWITNRPLNTSGTTTATGSNADGNSYNYYYKSVSASLSGVHSEEGVTIASLVDAAYADSSMSYVYWRSRYLTDERQDTSAGNNQTGAGDSVVRIRYWNSEWKYQNDGGVWVSAGDVNTTDLPQIVAYYLQKTTVTDEVTTLVVDHGIVPYTDYADSKYCLIDYAVKMESSERTPTSFPVSGKTQSFHCDDSDKNTVHSYNGTYYREIGTIFAQETSTHEVYMITATPSSSTLGSTTGYVRSYSYNTFDPENGESDPVEESLERVIWVDDEANLGYFTESNSHYTSYSGNITYFVGGEPNIPGVEILRQYGMLITYYVRAKATEDALTVHYIDASEGANNLEFYNYNIAVKEGTTFKAGIDLNKENPNGDLLNGDVINYYNRTQTVSADLSTLSQVGAQYLYTEYECVRVERRDDKNVYLYYKFDPTVYFVADFGLPMTITAADLSEKLVNATIKDMMFSGVQHTVYGQLTDKGTTVTYAPDEILQSYDYFTLLVETASKVDGILDEASTQIAFRVYIVPATTVYYEEGFLFTDGKQSGDWSGKTSISTEKIQATEKLGVHSNNYGYDPAYANDNTGSNNSCAIATVSESGGAYTSFTFTGTGFELYANSKDSSGIVTVLNKSGTVSKLYRINTVLQSGDTPITTYGLRSSLPTYYSLPIISETNLPYGTYTVQIKQNNTTDNGEIYIDGVRIINTIADSSIFKDDLEDNPDFYELRDMVLHAAGVGEINESDYISSNNRDGLVAAVKDMAGQVYNNTNGATAIIFDESLTSLNNETLKDLLDNGPKNELYLREGQTLKFSVNTNRVMQLGLKSPTGSANFTLTVTTTVKDTKDTDITDDDATLANNTTTLTLSPVSTTVDMFYAIADAVNIAEYEEQEDVVKVVVTHTVTITVNSGLLSVTKLKICDDPNAAFVALTQEDIENALLGIYGLTDDETPVEPEEPAADADAVLAITLTDGKKEMGTAELTAAGAEGESHTFTSEEILNAVLDVIPDLYKVADESAITDIAVKYGETGEITVDVELEFEFDMDSWWRQVMNLMNQIYTIIADAGEGGSITNEGSADVKFRKDITYTITPDEGYEIESVIVDGKDVGAVSEYTFRRVRNDHRISVVFREVQ